MSQDNRRSKLLIQPYLQLKMFLYPMILALAFAIAVLGILHSQWTTFKSWLALQALSDAAQDEVLRSVHATTLWLGVALVVFLISTLAVVVIATHRLIGPTVAFRRHIQRLIDGDVTARTTLRPHDAFSEVAEDLNRLSAALAARAEQGAPNSEPPPVDA